MAIFRSHQISFMISAREKAALAEFGKEKDLSVSQLVRRILVAAMKSGEVQSDKFVARASDRHSQINLRVSDAEREEILRYATELDLRPTRLVRDAVLTWIAANLPHVVGAGDTSSEKSEADRCTTTLSASKQGNPDQG